MTELHALIRPTTIFNPDGTTRPAWVAVGLEHFLVGCGETKQAALAELDQVVQATLAANAHQRKQPFEGLAPAPAKYHEAAQTAVPLPPHDLDGARVKPLAA